jgi:hypothetical protein
VKFCGLIVVGHVQHFFTSLFNDFKFLIVHRFNMRIVCLLEVNSTCVVFHCVD